MVNSFTLTTSDLAPVGVATSPICALFNHGCDPNAVIVFPRAGAGMCVVAITDIEPGQEVRSRCESILTKGTYVVCRCLAAVRTAAIGTARALRLYV